MKKLIIGILLLLFVMGCATTQVVTDVSDVPDAAKNRVYLTNFLECPRAYMLVDAEGDILAEGILAGYGHEGELEIESSFFIPPWTHELFLSAGTYYLVIWCPKHDDPAHKLDTLVTYVFEVTKDLLFPPKGEGPLTIEIVKDDNDNSIRE